MCDAHRRDQRHRQDEARGSAGDRGYGAAWRVTRARILKRDPFCRAPGCHEPTTDVDHIIPRRQGGTDADDNLQGLCHTHHSGKTAKQDGRWGR
jgi:5-methylcytosine-specific restriction protein A